MTYKYYLAYDDGNFVIRYTDTYDPSKLEVQRYDKTNKKWVTDYMLAGIFSGDILVKSITEKEAMKQIGS